MAEDEERTDEMSVRTRAFVTRRHALEEADAAALAARRPHLDQPHTDSDSPNPIALLGGILVLALLLAGFVFVVDRFRGDSWYSDCPARQSGNC
ncbi:MAG: hypothetical protein WCC64_07595 [Aliidongia sp.]